MPLTLGIDEVGRGPLAGPLVIGAVILGDDFIALPEYSELRDSKQLTEPKRRRLAKTIRDHATTHGLGWVKSTEIDQIGLSPALHLAARCAVKQALSRADTPKPDQIIIDGTINFLANTPYEAITTTLKKADNLVKEVSAASIIAKVARDYYMTELSTKYPEYGFDSHMGYGTATHLAALREYGPCPEHRRSFRPVAEALSISSSSPAQTETCHSSDTLKNTTSLGHTAESVVANYLESQGHHLVAQNFRTKSAEIDLVTIKDCQIFFTEVKYRNDSQHGSALAQITPAKLSQMHYASQIFLAKNPRFREFQPLLAAASVSGSDFTLEDWFIIQ